MKIIIKTLALGLLLAIPALAMDDLRKPIRLCKVMGAIGPDLEIDDVNPYSDHCYYVPGTIDYAKTRVKEGVNYFGYCKDRNCQGSMKAYVAVGKIEYLIRNGAYCHPPKCPICNQNSIEIEDWVFCNCCFQIEWQKPSGRGVRNWERADEQAYTISLKDLGGAEYVTVKIRYLGQKAVLPSNDL